MRLFPTNNYPHLLQVLRHTRREAGFHQSIGAEAQLHLQQDHFYTAVALQEASLQAARAPRANFTPSLTHLAQLSNRFAGLLAQRLVHKRMECAQIVDLANRLIPSLGPEVKFWEQLAFAALTCTLHSPLDYTLDVFRLCAEHVDPDRERVHLIQPLIARWMIGMGVRNCFFLVFC